MLQSVSQGYLSFVHGNKLVVVRLSDMQKIWQLDLSLSPSAITVSQTGWVAALHSDGQIDVWQWNHSAPRNIRPVVLSGIPLRGACLAALGKNLAVITSNDIRILSLPSLHPCDVIIATEPECVAKDDCLAVSLHNGGYWFSSSGMQKIDTHDRIVGVDPQGYILATENCAKRVENGQITATMTFEGIQLTPHRIACNRDMSTGVGVFFLPPPFRTVVLLVLVWCEGKVVNVGVVNPGQNIIASLVEGRACVVTSQSVLVWSNKRLTHAVSLAHLATNRNGHNRECKNNRCIDGILWEGKVYVDILQEPWSYILWWKSIPIPDSIEAWRSLVCGSKSRHLSMSITPSAS